VQLRLRSIRLEKEKLENKVEERTIELNEANEELLQQKEEIQIINENLNHQNEVLEVTLANLKHTQAELIQSEKMASLGQLIAGIAHEINTPLGAIKSSVSTITDSTLQSINLLPELIKTLSDDELKLFMSFINRSINSNIVITSKEERELRKKLTAKLEEKGIEDADNVADTLVDMGIYNDIDDFLPLFTAKTMLAAYHLTMQIKNSQNIKMAVDRAGKVVFALKNYTHSGNKQNMFAANIIEGLETVLILYSNQLKHGITLKKEFAEVPQILCYPDELNQVWTNLIHNAIQAMDGKGELSIRVLHQIEELEIRITDTGKGIPPEIKNKIFDAFFTTKPAGEGSGLGLHIVKQIIDKHKGKILVESEVGKGTTFMVFLPSGNENVGISNV
jgi:signal transduction histidine kinase